MPADLRLLVALALHSSNLQQSDLRETPVDRIGALAFADPLGGALWSLRWANKPAAYKVALALLSRRSKRTCKESQMRDKLCSAALQEWLFDLCPKCMGRGSLEATPNSPALKCDECGGTTRRKTSILWRAHQLGLDPHQYRKWDKKYEIVFARIVDSELRAYEQIAKQLGRRGVN